jgi:hypothetical protein
MGGLQALLVLAGLLAIYFFPTLMALRAWSGTGAPPKKNVGAIFALNLLLGWTFVGWVIALVWALTKDQDAVPSNVLARLTTEPDRPFETEAVLRGFPYRVRENGTVEAMMTGGLVQFRDMEQFRAAAEGRDAVKTKASAPVPKPFDPNQTIVDWVLDLPTGSRIDRKFKRRVAYLPDGTVTGETDNGPKNFKTFEEWRRFISK